MEIAIIIILVSALAFIIGLIIGAKIVFNLTDKEDDTDQYFYCFNCEIEMPVKEKKGVLRCKNCGLRH